MPIITIYSLRKNTHSLISRIESEYILNQKKYWQIKLVDIRIAHNSNESAINIQKKEFALIAKKNIPAQSTILLTPEAREKDTHSFSKYLQQMIDNNSRIQFIIGGAYGFDKRVKQLFPHQLSLSKLTFNHELTRLILLEQLFRAGNLLTGGSYHK